MTSTSMNNLYNQLNQVGIKKAFAKKIFPDWWDDSIASDEAGLQQAHLYVSRAFNIELASLEKTNLVPSFRQVEHKFKLNSNVTVEDVSVGAHYVTAIAKLALKAIHTTSLAVIKDPAELRAHILKTSQFVNLNSLLGYCSEIGIPVLHIEKLPSKKMIGLAIRIDGKYAIVLSKKAHPAYLLFHLAHELGHIAKGHLTKDGFIADTKIGSNNTNDADEKEADAYAIRLLNGAEVQYTTQGKLASGIQLYVAALAKAESIQVDVGHIILNFANTNKCFPLANIALKHLPGSDSGADVVNKALFKTLNHELLSDDQLQLLVTATGYQLV